MPPDASGDTELARRATGGDGEAFGLLFDRWLDRAFDVAWHILHSQEAAADATQEAFAAAWQQIGDLRQPESFGGWLLRIARNKALNHLQKQRRSSPVGSEETLAMMDARRTEDPSGPLNQREHTDLVWAASAALGEEDASLLNLHLRNDLGAAELAEELGVKPNAAHQRLFRLKKRLAEAIGAWVLWRSGTPSCPELSDALAQAEATSFDGTTAKAILAHARRCESCDSSRKLRLSPEALFATLPVVAAGPVLRTRMAAALDGQGVPVGSAVGDEPGSALQGDDPGARDDSGGRELDEAAESPEGAAPHEPTAPAEPRTPSEDAAPDDPVEVVDPATETDAGEPDAGEPDAGEPDAGEPDAGEPDAGEPDAGEPDAGEPDAGGQGWRRLARVGAPVAVVLLGGVGVLALLVDRSGNGSSDEAGTRTVGGDGITSEETTTEPADLETGETTATSETPSSGEDGEPSAPDPAVGGSTPAGSAPAGPTGPGTAGSPGSDTRPEAAAPEIVRFTSVATGQQCHRADPAEVRFSWATTGATSAALGPEGGEAEPVPPSSSLTECAQPGSTWILTASGPGGAQVSQETVVPREPTPSTRPPGPGDLTNP